MLSASPEMLLPKRSDSQLSDAVIVPEAIGENDDAAADAMAFGSSAVLMARFARSFMKPRSSARCATIPAVVGTTAPNPFITADSISPVCPATRDRISGVSRLWMFSRMEAMGCLLILETANDIPDVLEAGPGSSPKPASTCRHPRQDLAIVSQCVRHTPGFGVRIGEA